MLRSSLALCAMMAFAPSSASLAARSPDRPAALISAERRASRAEQPVTIFLVRHAEKGPEPTDPALTARGRARAQELARVLQDAGVTGLFATEFKRTRETVAPLGKALGITPVITGAGNVPGLIARLQALPAGSRVVVASHSNLVHLIVAGLTGAQLTQLTDTDYDRLFVVTLTGKGTGSVVVLRFGER